MTLIDTIKISIAEQFANTRLDKALAATVAQDTRLNSLGLSRARLQALIKSGRLCRLSPSIQMINDPDHKTAAGEVYQLDIPPALAAEPQAQPIALTILYEDNDVIVINKPPGLVVHPAAGNRDGTLVNALLAHCGASLSGIGGVARPGIVHRLDKDTSGLMVVAKHDAAHQALAAQFADRSLSRIYQALVWGAPQALNGQIEAPLGRHPSNRKKMAVVSRGGKSALTFYQIINAFGTMAALVECRLATGRTHQIRVHMAHIKHPIIGDPVYGGRVARNMAALCPEAAQFPRQALHAAALKFIHPVNHKPMKFHAEMPSDMRALSKALARLRK